MQELLKHGKCEELRKKEQQQREADLVRRKKIIVTEKRQKEGRNLGRSSNKAGHACQDSKYLAVDEEIIGMHATENFRNGENDV